MPVQVVVDAMVEAKEDFEMTILKKQYEDLKQAIPKEWVKRIESKEKEDNKMEVLVKVGEKHVDFKLCAVKVFYICFRDSVFRKSLANQFWQKIFPEIDEKKIWSNINWKYLDTRVECLDYYIRQNMIFSEMKLYKIGMAQITLCKVCEEKNEGILHLFLYCTELEELMGILKKIVPMLMEMLGKNKLIGMK